MRKLFLFAFLLPLAAFTRLDWSPVKLDDRVSLSFPSQPTQSEFNGNQMWMSDIDAGTRVMAMIVDMEKLGVDSASLTPYLDQPEFYESFRNGALNNMPGATLVDEKHFQINGVHVYDMAVKYDDPSKSKYTKVYIRNMILGSKIYALNFFENKSTDNLRNKFFDSFRKN
jgi:hypothetical protein